jgi:hypothetical protein
MSTPTTITEEKRTLSILLPEAIFRFVTTAEGPDYRGTHGGSIEVTTASVPGGGYRKKSFPLPEWSIERIEQEEILTGRWLWLWPPSA